MSRRWQQADRALTEELDGQAVVLLLPDRQLHRLDEVATRAWALFAGPRTAADAAAALAATHAAPLHRVQADLEALLDVLAEAGLLVPA